MIRWVGFPIRVVLSLIGLVFILVSLLVITVIDVVIRPSHKYEVWDNTKYKWVGLNPIEDSVRMLIRFIKDCHSWVLGE